MLKLTESNTIVHSRNSLSFNHVLIQNPPPSLTYRFFNFHIPCNGLACLTSYPVLPDLSSSLLLPLYLFCSLSPSELSYFNSLLNL